jgi:hypothetical protein
VPLRRHRCLRADPNSSYVWTHLTGAGQFYFQLADIVAQILNFGLPAQIDVRTVGYDRATNHRVSREMQRRIAVIPEVANAHLQQEIDGPAFYVNARTGRLQGGGLFPLTLRHFLRQLSSLAEDVADEPEHCEKNHVTVSSAFAETLTLR